MMTPDDALTPDTIAVLPNRGPWAAQVLAGAIVFGLEDVTIRADHWPGAPSPVRMLSTAIALAGHRWSMHAAGGEEWAFCLAPGSICPHLQVSNAQAFVLARSEHHLGYAVTWSEQDETVQVHWFDDADGSHSLRGPLEEWCRTLVVDWLLALRGDEPNIDTPQLSKNSAERLSAFLQAIAVRRATEVSRFEAAVVELEKQIQESGQLADNTYNTWSLAVDRLAVLSRPPWPEFLVPQT